MMGVEYDTTVRDELVAVFTKAVKDRTPDGSVEAFDAAWVFLIMMLARRLKDPQPEIISDFQARMHDALKRAVAQHAVR